MRTVLEGAQLQSPLRGWDAAHREHLIAIAALLFSACAMQATAQQSSPSPSSGGASDYVGAKVCASCHSQEAQSLVSNPHAKTASMSGEADSCETCHGPGRAHADSRGVPAKIFNPAAAPAPQVNQRCLACHTAQLARFSQSVHSSTGLSCLACHTVHGNPAGQPMLKAQQPALCLQCHSNVAPDFFKPFHHMTADDRMTCSTCHDPHRIPPQESGSPAALNAICAQCHKKEAGPFTYPHPAVQLEGCVSCHSPHGSEHSQLLNQSDANALCQSCHDVSGSEPHARKLSATGHADGLTAQKSRCIDCHPSFHGSNADTTFLK